MHVAYFASSLKDARAFENIIKDISQVKMVTSFYDSVSFLRFIRENNVDFVFLDVELRYENNLLLTDIIKEINYDTNVIYVSLSSEHAVAAFEEGAFGYILKPFVLEKILIPLNRVIKKLPKVEIRTFGTFDLFVDNTAVLFSNKKAKEMLALMVDYCGKNLNMEQIIDVLWEERPFDDNTKALYRIALKDLRDTLKKFKCEYIIKESRGQRSLDTTKVKCDYYDYLKHPDTYSGFFGEYMTNYSWGEYTLAKISGNFY